MAPRGTIKSENYPSPYPDNAECVWFIKAEEGMKVKIIYQDFDVPTGGEQCFDFLKLQNVGEPLARFDCGPSLPPEFISRGNEVKVEFRTHQNKDQHTGFHLNYVTFPESNNFITSSKSAIAETLTQAGVYV